MMWFVLLAVALLPISAQASTFYVAAAAQGGSNTNDGTTPTVTGGHGPFETFAFAINSSRAWCGDTLFVVSGTLGNTTTSGNMDVNSVVCTRDAKLTIAALDPRQAIIADSGCGKAIWVRKSAWIVIDGFYLTSVTRDDCPNSPNITEAGLHIQVRQSHDIVARNNVGFNVNHYPNTAAMGAYYSRTVWFEDNEVYGFHRHCFTGYRSEAVIVRRQYCNPRGGKIAGGFSQGGMDLGTGDAVFSMYPCKDCILENSIADGTETPMFLNEMNATYLAPSPADSPPPGQPPLGNVLMSGSKVLGNICYRCGAGNGVVPNGRPGINDIQHTPHNVSFVNNAFIDFWSRGIGMKMADVVENIPGHVTVDHATIMGLQPLYNQSSNPDKNLNRGIELVDSVEGTGPAENSITIQNVLVTNMLKHGILVDSGAYNTWTINETISTGNGTNYSPSSDPPSTTQTLTNTSTAAHNMGTCKVWVPATATGKGAGVNGEDIGANILYRYVDGVLTKVPLWDANTGAFPMAQPFRLNLVSSSTVCLENRSLIFMNA